MGRDVKYSYKTLSINIEKDAKNVIVKLNGKQTTEFNEDVKDRKSSDSLLTILNKILSINERAVKLDIKGFTNEGGTWMKLDAVIETKIFIE